MSGFEALGVACNIMQVIESAGKIISTCKAFHNGQPTAIDELRREATRMSDASKEIQHQNQTPSSPNSTELFDIATECFGISLKLQKLIGDLPASSAKSHWWASFKAALKVRLRKGKIEEIEKALEKQKATMNTHILVDQNMRNDARDLIQSSEFENMSKELQRFATQCAGNFEKVSKVIESQHEHTREHSSALAAQTADAINIQVTSEISKLGTANVSQAERDRFLNSLKFSLMNARYNMIERSHEKTWIRVFNPTRPEEVDSASDHKDSERAWGSFVSWLKSAGTCEPYWISGKPGSGKSTLFKFLIENEETLGALRVWASDAVVLKHFFWRIGQEMQSNLKGLLCSFIYQLAIQDDQLIPRLLGQSKTCTLKDSDADWSTDELEQAFFGILQGFPKPICFFIDGLDEVTGPRGVEGLLVMLEKLLRLDNVKVCVSSRPEYRFQETLAKYPHLELHELTRSDMKAYAVSRLGESRAMNCLSERTRREIVSRLLFKAGGVFLWLSLAISSLQEGLVNADEEDELLQRLELLPETLESLYEDMWTRLNEGKTVYREKAARYLNTVLSWTEWVHFLSDPTPFRIMASQDGEIQAMLLNMREPVTESHEVQIRQSCDKMTREIVTKCAGLLQVSSAQHGHSVDFIHRTAVDFLVDKEAGIRIRRWDSSTPQQLRLALLKGYLCQARYEHQTIKSKDAGQVRDVELILMALSRHYATNQLQKPKEDTSSVLHMSWGMFNQGIFSGFYNPRPHFLARVAEHPELHWFVVEALEKEGPGVASQILWDLFSLDSNSNRRHFHQRDPVPSPVFMAQMLLSHGAKLDEPVNASWRHCRSSLFPPLDSSEAIRAQLLNNLESSHSPAMEHYNHQYTGGRTCTCAFSRFSSPIEHYIVSTLVATTVHGHTMFGNDIVQFMLNEIENSPTVCCQYTSIFMTDRGTILDMDELQHEYVRRPGEVVDLLVLEVNLTNLIHMLCECIEPKWASEAEDSKYLETIKTLSTQAAPPFSRLRYWTQFSRETGFKNWLRPLDDQSEPGTVEGGRFRYRGLQPAPIDKDISHFTGLGDRGITDLPRKWRSMYSSGLTVLAQERLGMCFTEDAEPKGGYIG